MRWFLIDKNKMAPDTDGNALGPQIVDSSQPNAAEPPFFPNPEIYEWVNIDGFDDLDIYNGVVYYKDSTLEIYAPVFPHSPEPNSDLETNNSQT